MSVLYFKNDEASFQEQIFSLQMILAIHINWSKAQIINISDQRQIWKKIRILKFLESLRKQSVLTFINFGL